MGIAGSVKRVAITGIVGGLILTAGIVVTGMRGREITGKATSVLSSHTPVCKVYGVDDIDNFDSQFFSADIFSGSSITKLTPVYSLYNIESMEYDPVANLFYAGSGGIRNQGLFVLPADFSAIQRVYNPGYDEHITGLAYRSSNQTLYGWSNTGGMRGLVRYSKTGTKYNGVPVFDRLTFVMPGPKIDGIAWYNDYLYAIDEGGDWYKGNRAGEPTGLIVQPPLPGVPPSVQESGALDISKEGMMLIGTEAAGKAVGLLAYDITVSPAVLLTQYSIVGGTVEDTEGLVWPDPCYPPVGTTPTITPGGSNTPIPTRTPTSAPSSTPVPSAASTPGYSIYCPT